MRRVVGTAAVLGVVLVTGACTSTQRVPAHVTSTSRSTRAVPSTPASSSSTTTSHVGTLVGPWRATMIDDLPLAWGSIVGLDGALFGLTQPGNPAQLVRVDPATGRVQRRVVVDAEAVAPIAAHNAIWVASDGRSGSVTLRWYDPVTLAARGVLTLAAHGAFTRGVELSADGAGDRIFVAAGDTVDELDTATGHVVSRRTVDGEVAGIAASPDGSLLYVDSVAGSVDGTLRVIDTRSGSTVRLLRGLTVSDADTGVHATDSGGLWVSTAGGHTQQLSFLSRADLDAGRTSGIDEGDGGGGPYATVTFARGLAWIGGPLTIACADPDTGQRFATATLPTPYAGVLSGITFVDDTAYGVYAGFAPGDPSGVVRMSPPPACTRQESGG